MQLGHSGIKAAQCFKDHSKAFWQFWILCNERSHVRRTLEVCSKEFADTFVISEQQAEVVDQVVKEEVDCKEKEEVGKASNNTNENLYLARGCGLGLGGWQHVLFDGQVGGGRDRG